MLNPSIILFHPTAGFSKKSYGMLANSSESNFFFAKMLVRDADVCHSLHKVPLINMIIPNVGGPVNESQSTKDHYACVRACARSHAVSTFACKKLTRPCHVCLDHLNEWPHTSTLRYAHGVSPDMQISAI